MIYGWSWKNWNDHYLIAFNNLKTAETWLYTPENDFRSRELITEEKAAELAGDYFYNWDQNYKLYLTE